MLYGTPASVQQGRHKFRFNERFVDIAHGYSLPPQWGSLHDLLTMRGVSLNCGRAAWASLVGQELREGSGFQGVGWEMAFVLVGRICWWFG